MNIFKIKLNKRGACPTESFRRGFTLIELLVVISIIGLLSSIVLASLEDARAKARDARRMSDIKQIQNALELYRNDNGKYPTNTAPGFGGSTAWAAKDSTDSGAQTNWNSLETDLAKYIPKLPADPKPSACSLTQSNNTCYGYVYLAHASGNDMGCPHQQYYLLIYRLEANKTANPKISPVSRCDNGTIFNIFTDIDKRNGLVTTGMGK